MSSEYVDTYLKHALPSTESCKPAYDLRKSDAKVSGKTTFRVDYIPHALPEKRQIIKQSYKPPGTPMEAVSMYQQDYPLVKAERPEPVKRKDTRSVPTTKFDTIPTYASEFKKWNVMPRVNFRAEREYKLPEQKMENISTFRRDYIPYSAARRESAKPPNVAFRSDEPLQSKTIHNINFIPYKMEPRPPREIRKYTAPEVSMDTATTHRQSYVGTQAAPAESAKPPQIHFMSNEPLASSSEFRDSFVAWPVEKPHRHEMARYKKPQGEIDLQTTQRLEFKHVLSRPAESKKPDPKRTKTMPFVGVTNYQTDFKRWRVPREPVKLREESLHPSGKFEGQSTTRLHFVRHSAHPARSCKPDGKVLLSDAPLDDHTIYRTDFVRKPLDCVERYPTPEWLKQQFQAWTKSSTQNGKTAVSYMGGMTPQATNIIEAIA